VLTQPERDSLDRERILDVVGKVAQQTGNVRKLGKLVEETISTLLVRRVLDDPSLESEAVNGVPTA
jgi:hypothetical protein